jgi:hypothetical protein
MFIICLTFKQPLLICFSTESSIPSSFEKLSINVPGGSYRMSTLPASYGSLRFPTSSVIGVSASEVPQYNRGRRGGLISDDPLTVAAVKTTSGKI